MSKPAALFNSCLMGLCTLLALPAYADCSPANQASLSMAQAGAQQTGGPAPSPKPDTNTQQSAEQASDAKQKAAVEAYEESKGNIPSESWFGCDQGVNHQGGDEKDCLPQHQDKTQVIK